MNFLIDTELDGYKRTAYYLGFLSYDEAKFVAVPDGFVTDGYSVPVGILFDPFDHPQPAVLHDWLYAYPDGLSRAACDRIFMEAMRHYKVPFMRRWLFYWAVRLFGGKAWRESRADDMNEQLECCTDSMTL